MLQKSPSGSLCPYYYMGGELHPLHYGSYHDDQARLFAVIKAEEAFILNAGGTNNRRIWIDLYETALDDAAVDFLVAHLTAIRHKIFRLCLVGCSAAAKRKLRARMKLVDTDLFTQTQYFSDPEDGKQWLVGKAGA